MHIGDAHRQSRAAVVAVILFLVFDSLALGLNFWLTWRIESQAIGINLAGRQRMLSQRMVKVLMQYEDALAQKQSTEAISKELALTFKLFDNTLQGFDKGQQTRGGADEELFLPAVSGAAARAVVEEAVAIWQPYRNKVLQVIEAPDRVAELLPIAVRSAQENNLELLKLMNQLTTELELLTKKEASQIRYFQGAAFLLALINFFGAFILYARRVRQADRNQDLLDEIINKVSASVLLTDERRTVLKANRTAEHLFGYLSGELQGLQEDVLITGKEGNRIGHRKDGSTFLALTEANETRLDDRRFCIETVVDVTQQRMTEEHLTSLAYHDLLTKLPNRLLFDDRLRVELAHAQRRKQKLGVLFIDLDHFKPVNDEFGHEIGDYLLQEVAIRLQDCVRDSDTVSRRGGDEFTVLVTDAEDRDSIAKVARLILDALHTPFHIEGLTLQIGCSIGISIFPEHAQESSSLLACADAAMYDAKENGRGIYRFAPENSILN